MHLEFVEMRRFWKKMTCPGDKATFAPHPLDSLSNMIHWSIHSTNGTMPIQNDERSDHAADTNTTPPKEKDRGIDQSVVSKTL